MPLQDNHAPFGDNQPKVTRNGDIVWVLDVSGSMSDIIQAVKNNIAQFVRDLANSNQKPVDSLRLGLVTHDVNGNAAVHAADFVDTAEDFVANLNSAPDGGDEFGLPAIDRALDFPWRKNCRRYIVFITDESVSGGHDPSRQTAMIESIKQKVMNQHVYLLGFGPSCPHYEDLGTLAGCDYTAAIPSTSDHGALSGVGFLNVLKGLAKTMTS